MDYLKFASNVFSQNGEDGIIQQILPSVVGDSTDLWCVEFGAWDGKHMSNTFNLVSNFDWRAVYIEGNPEYFELLKETVIQFPKITPILSMVSPEKDSRDSLDQLLQATSVPRDFHLLSIDIDSYDLAIWESLGNYSPLIVIIEINSGIYPGIYEWHHQGGRGNSFSSTLKVAQAKGYTLICHTGNMLFVRKDYVGKLDLTTTQIAYPEVLFNYFQLPVEVRKSIRSRLSGKIRSFLT
jgi:hypothetical protein